MAANIRKSTFPFFIFFLAFSACVESNNAIAAPDIPEKSLKAYATALAKKSPADLSVSGSPVQSLESPLSYRTVFIANNAWALPTNQASGGAQSNSEANLARTKKWQATYCTDELRAIMQQHTIKIASANLIDAKGQSRSIAMCISQSAKSPPPPKDLGATGEGVFSSVQICRAALSVTFGRDISIMKGRIVDGLAQVKYVRNTDKRELSYRCKLENNFVLTWDESISDARWYGGNASDFQIRYSVSGKILLIQDMIKGEVNKEKQFSLAELGG